MSQSELTDPIIVRVEWSNRYSTWVAVDDKTNKIITQSDNLKEFIGCIEDRLGDRGHVIPSDLAVALLGFSNWDTGVLAN